LNVRRIAVPLVVLSTAVLAACGGASGNDATPTAAPPTATATPDVPDLTIFRNFMYPIAGACLPAGDQLMPNAPREYRGGVHEGVDFYDYDNCTTIERGTPALAAKDGIVLRADLDYTDLTQEELTAANERIANGDANNFDVLDLFRGRQVWIDHGNGIVTRHAHLSGIPPEIVVGTRVAQGETIGFVGDSGTPESLSNPGQEMHLHWELRAGDAFLGAGLPPVEVREIYIRLFEQLD
jgi:murein DD-endopeptidase MepM/ murein hydrolase activator NlpD